MEAGWAAEHKAAEDGWAAERRAEANEGLYRNLREKYDVELIDISDAGEHATSTQSAGEEATSP